MRLSTIKGEIGIKTSQTLYGLSEGEHTLDELKEKGWGVEKVVRTVPHVDKYDNYVPKPNEFKKGKPVPGTVASLIEGRNAAKAVLDYWNRRIKLGDPLFDQWMVDERKKAQKAVDGMEELIDWFLSGRN